MRVFVGGVFHESNAFSPVPTGIDDYECTSGAEPLETLQSRFFGYGDLAMAAAQAGCTVHAGFYACAQPAAPSDRASYEELRHRLIRSLREAGTVDIVLLFLHGAHIAEGYDDCQTDIVRHTRAVVGPDVPIGVELDLHANATRQLIDAADVVLCCWEYPHIDFGERARKLVAACLALARGAQPRRVWFRALPAIANLPTRSGPGADLLSAMAKAEADGEALVSVAHGFALSDTPDTHAAVWVYADDRGQGILDTIVGSYLRSAQESHAQAPLRSVEEALDLALGCGVSPVVLADRSDNAGAGAAGDATFVLQALLARGVTDAAIGMIWDPAAVQAAHRAGVGARLRLRIGGHCGPLSGETVEEEVEVLATRSDLAQQVFGIGQAMPLGLSAALRVRGVLVVVNTIRQQTMSREVFTGHGIDPARMRLLVVKSTNHFQEDFGRMAARIIHCDAPGAGAEDLSTFAFQRLPRPCWPLDPLDAALARTRYPEPDMASTGCAS